MYTPEGYELVKTTEPFKVGVRTWPVDVILPWSSFLVQCWRQGQTQFIGGWRDTKPSQRCSSTPSPSPRHQFSTMSLMVPSSACHGRHRPNARPVVLSLKRRSCKPRDWCNQHRLHQHIDDVYQWQRTSVTITVASLIKIVMPVESL